MSPKRTILVWVGVIITMACNDYDSFRVSGYEQESFSNKADILFVIDNSDSMKDEAVSLAVNFEDFILELTSSDDEDATTEGLSDAVEDYINFAGRGTASIDYQLGLTTTDVAEDFGALLGSPSVLKKSTNKVASKFQSNLICDAACIPESQIDDDINYNCGDPLDPNWDEVPAAYIECECGDNFITNCAETGDEEPLEAVFMAICRAVDNPPDECFDEINQFTNSQVGSNSGWLRDESSIIPVIVTDEGDQSRRASTGKPDTETYDELFELFRRRIAFAVIGPGHLQCNTGAADWGVERLEHYVATTNGLWVNIAEPDISGDCAQSDFGAALQELGNLLRALLDAFPLSGVPDPNTIIVVVDGKIVDQAESIGGATWTDGWSYDATENVVMFHGSALPDFNADVRIYYLPTEGMPRELPF